MIRGLVYIGLMSSLEEMKGKLDLKGPGGSYEATLLWLKIVSNFHLSFGLCSLWLV